MEGNKLFMPLEKKPNKMIMLIGIRLLNWKLMSIVHLSMLQNSRFHIIKAKIMNKSTANNMHLVKHLLN